MLKNINEVTNSIKTAVNCDFTFHGVSRVTANITDNFIIELTWTDFTRKNKYKSLPWVWYKNGHITKEKANKLYNGGAVFIHTYFTDEKGICWGRYNPQTKTGKTLFDEVNPISVSEVYRLIHNAIELYMINFENINDIHAKLPTANTLEVNEKNLSDFITTWGIKYSNLPLFNN